VVGAEAALAEAMLPLRRKAWLARLDAVREEVRGLVVKDEFEAVGKVGERVARELAGEAKALGLEKQLEDVTSRCRAFGKLAAAAKKKG
jgi:hypothetical protein